MFTDFIECLKSLYLLDRIQWQFRKMKISRLVMERLGEDYDH